MKENLLLVARDFVRRSRTHSQTEDFFTEILAALLRLSADFRSEFLALVLEEPTHEAIELPVWEIFTQEEAQVGNLMYGVPDLVLKGAQSEEAPYSHLIAVEVKLDTTLHSEQLTKYDDWLREEQPDYEFVSLSALTTSERARSAARQADLMLENWSSWIRWAQVEDILSSHLDYEVDSAGGPESSREEHCFFHIYGQAFASLLADEGLVPPSPLRPSEDATLFQEDSSGASESRQTNLAHLLHQALRDCGAIEFLETRDPAWKPMRARDGLPHRTQHHKGVQLRQRFQAGSFDGVFFSFGLVYYVRGWLLRDGEVPHDLRHLELAAALEVWHDAGSKEANHLSWVLSGEGRMVRPVDTLRGELNSELGGEEKVFVPTTNYRWAKFVCRHSTQELAGKSKDAQKAQMGKFFSGFINAFEGVSGKSLGYSNLTLLNAMGKLLESSSV
jgi:hypothetical protein